MEAWKHLRAIIMLTGMVTLVIPGSMLWLSGTDYIRSLAIGSGVEICSPSDRWYLICLGLVLLVATIRLFVTVGQGTLAPWEPPQRLVVRGVYRHVRNPMISGVIFVLLGAAVLAASLPLFGWFLWSSSSTPSTSRCRKRRGWSNGSAKIT